MLLSRLTSNIAMPHNVRRILESGWTFDKLWELPDVESEGQIESRKSGIYLLLYRNLNAGGPGNHAIYVGQTINFTKRRNEHARFLPASTIKHYVIGRRAASWKMIVFTRLSQIETELW